MAGLSSASIGKAETPNNEQLEKLDFHIGMHDDIQLIPADTRGYRSLSKFLHLGELAVVIEVSRRYGFEGFCIALAVWSAMGSFGTIAESYQLSVRVQAIKLRHKLVSGAKV